MSVSNLLVVGQTGAGKSQGCESLARNEGHVGAVPFVVGGGAESHTRASASLRVAGIEIIDTPGLMDTNGLEQDMQNLANIVQKAKSYNYVNAAILVLNERHARYDRAMQGEYCSVSNCRTTL
jgi:predicted GTPase